MTSNFPAPPYWDDLQPTHDLSLFIGVTRAFLHLPARFIVRAGSSFSGYDDTPSDNSTADAADPSAASPEPSAAPGSSPAATGPHVTAGNVQAAAVIRGTECFQRGMSQFGIKKKKR